MERMRHYLCVGKHFDKLSIFVNRVTSYHSNQFEKSETSKQQCYLDSHEK